MRSQLALIGGEEFTTVFEDIHASLLQDTGCASANDEPMLLNG